MNIQKKSINTGVIYQIMSRKFQISPESNSEFDIDLETLDSSANFELGISQPLAFQYGVEEFPRIPKLS